ncbi:unnamed protein product, partial [Rotaria magnacalcarata]
MIEIETQLLSQSSPIDDENYFHRQLNELNELHNHLKNLEKSINELLKQSEQLNNEKLSSISEQLASRGKQTTLEIIQRKRSIKQMIEAYRSFKKLFEQEERTLYNIEKRMQHLEPISNDAIQLKRMSKIVTDLFNDILFRAQLIEHMNDVAIKFIQEVKMHDKNLKHFRASLCYPSMSIKQQKYPSNIQNASRAVLHKVEGFD